MLRLGRFSVLFLAGTFAGVALFPQMAIAAATSPTTVRAKPIPADEKPGERPYEMVRANRQPAHKPLVNFDSLDGWTLECMDGASGDLYGSQKQRVWESPVARLVYRGTSAKSAVVLRPPQPIPIPNFKPEPRKPKLETQNFLFAATILIHGNNWSWVPDPTTPQVTVSLLILDGAGNSHVLDITRVVWKEWWLVHKVIPKDLAATGPLQFAGIRVRGCANKEDRELYFEDLCFFEESLKPLSFAPRPKRGMDPFPGQDPGANTGPGRLPFPTREETILPENLAAGYKTNLVQAEKGLASSPTFTFTYDGPDTRLEYEVHPTSNSYWGPVIVRLRGITIAQALVGAGPVFPTELQKPHLTRSEVQGDVLRATWEGTLNGEKVAIESAIRLWQKSLVEIGRAHV